jgi:DNA polymerase I-like protein with 3'-5' exonuclease and polymerase domains
MKHLTLDVETTIQNKGNPFSRLNKLCLIGLYNNGIYDIEYTEHPYRDDLDRVQSVINNYDMLVGFNIKFDLHWIRKYGIDFQEKRIWDCQLVHFILTGQSKPYPSLNQVCEHYGLETKLDVVKEEYWKNGIDTNEIPRDILDEYLLKDLELTEQVYLKQLEDVKANPHFMKLISLHNQDLLVLEEMEFNGILYDQDKSEILGNELEEQIAKLDKRLYSYHNFAHFNASSVDHVSALLYGGTIRYREQEPDGVFKSGQKKGQVRMRWRDKELELPRLVKPLKGTELEKEGLYSTDEQTLRSLGGSKKASEAIKLILTRAVLEKRMTAYYKGLVNLIEEQNWDRGHIYGQLNQCVARTGRLSSSKPNLQNFDTEIKGLLLSRY